MRARELQALSLEVVEHFLQYGYPDAVLFVTAGIATEHDPTVRMARVALELFRGDRTFGTQATALLKRLDALLDDLAAMEEGEPA
jgi:hypothetical protein